jgi:hypothetical protein
LFILYTIFLAGVFKCCLFESSIPHEVNSIQVTLNSLHFKVIILSMPLSRYYSITPPTLRLASYIKLSVKVPICTKV